jgi:hypothetical protein
MRRLTMPCNCCQMSWAVKNARSSPGSVPMQRATASISRRNATMPGKASGGTSVSWGSGLANITW